jgi:hypothetical protein
MSSQASGRCRSSSRFLDGFGKIPHRQPTALWATCQCLPFVEDHFTLTAFRTVFSFVVRSGSCFHNSLLWSLLTFCLLSISLAIRFLNKTHEFDSNSHELCPRSGRTVREILQSSYRLRTQRSSSKRRPSERIHGVVAADSIGRPQMSLSSLRYRRVFMQ